MYKRQHHTYTNVLGKDHDLGYGIMRVDEDQRWVPFYLGQPAWNLITVSYTHLDVYKRQGAA